MSRNLLKIIEQSATGKQKELDLYSHIWDEAEGKYTVRPDLEMSLIEIN